MIPNKVKGYVYPLKLDETQPIDATNLRKMLFEQPADKGVKLHWNPDLDLLKGNGELYIRLLAQGYRDLGHWARKLGIKPHQAKNAYRRWRNRDTGFPRGETLQVLVKLSKTVCFPVSPVLEPYYPHFKGARLEYNLNWIQGKKKKNGNLTSNED